MLFRLVESNLFPILCYICSVIVLLHPFCWLSHLQWSNRFLNILEISSGLPGPLLRGWRTKLCWSLGPTVGLVKKQPSTWLREVGVTPHIMLLCHGYLHFVGYVTAPNWAGNLTFLDRYHIKTIFICIASHREIQQWLTTATPFLYLIVLTQSSHTFWIFKMQRFKFKMYFH